MTAKLFALPLQTILTNAGALIPGAKAYFYLAGTTTAQAVYTNTTLAIAHSQPVVADGNGRFPAIYLDGGVLYKVVITDASDVEIYTEDNFQDITGQFQNLRLEGGAPLITAKETSAGADNGVWRWGANSEDWYLELVNDAETSVQRVITISRTGMTTDTFDLTSTAFSLNGDTVVTEETGTFSVDWTGFSTSESTTFSYVKSGSMVTITPNASVSATSNVADFFSDAAAVPAAIRPTNGAWGAFRVVDNGTTQYGLINVSATGFVGLGVVGGLGGFTASGTKGIFARSMFTYIL